MFGAVRGVCVVLSLIFVGYRVVRRNKRRNMFPVPGEYKILFKDGETPLFDGLGSERTVTNSSQTVTSTATYEGFGQTIATTGSSSDPYMFAATSGYRNDGDAGLMHVGARYYDAQVGRFITRDTHLDQKPYLYCVGDPVNNCDPSGHIALPLWVQQIIDFNTPSNMPSWGWAGGSAIIGTAGSVDYMRNPPAPGDRFHNGLGIGSGVLGIGGGAGLISGGLAAIGGEVGIGAAIGASIAVTGGVAVIGIGAVAIVYGVGHIFGRW